MLLLLVFTLSLLFSFATCCTAGPRKNVPDASISDLISRFKTPATARSNKQITRGKSQFTRQSEGEARPCVRGVTTWYYVGFKSVEQQVIYNEGFMSLEIFGGGVCSGPAEEYSWSLNACLFDSIDGSATEDDLPAGQYVMKKYVNLTINSDSTITLTELLFQNANCRHFLTSNTYSVPSCIAAGGRSFGFKYRAVIPTFATDGVLSM
jgi:hypothetical protein